MNVTAEQVASAAQQLAAIAGVFDPKNAAAIVLLVRSVTELNLMVKAIREQNEADAQKVWDKVKANFEQSVAAFEASTSKKVSLSVGS